MNASAPVVTARPAPPRRLLAWRVRAEHAEHWARGILTDFALRLADAPGGPALFVCELAGHAAWRDLAAAFRRPGITTLIFRARSPVIDRRARRYGLRPWHRDEWANRYLATGDALARFARDLTT